MSATEILAVCGRCCGRCCGLAALLLVGCASPAYLGGHPSAPPSEEALAELERAERTLTLEDHAGAVDQLDALRREYPWFVQAHRRYQEALVASLRKGTLLAEYGDLLARYPLRAEAQYLYGRLVHEWSDKQRFFERALELDPGFAWAHFGLAVARMVAGDLDAAERRIARALEIEPHNAEFFLAHIEILRELGDEDRVLAAFSRARHRFPDDWRFALGLVDFYLELDLQFPATRLILEVVASATMSPGVYRSARRYVKRYPEWIVPRSFEQAMLSAGAALRRSAERPRAVLREYQLLAAEVAVAMGRWESAVRMYRSARENGAHTALFSEGLRTALVHTRQYARALESWNAGLPRGLLHHPASEMSGTFSELEAATSAMEHVPGDAGACLRLARAYRAVGWLDEAHCCASLAALLDPDTEAEALALVGEVEGFKSLLAELHKAIETGYERGTGPALDELVDELRASARGILGSDPGETRIDAISFFVDRVDPTVQEGGIPGLFNRFGRFLLLGKILFAPVEAYCMREVHRRPIQARVLGRDLAGTIVVGEGRDIGASGELYGDAVAGAAVHRGYFVNLDVVRDWTRAIELLARRFPAEQRAAILNDPLPVCAPRDRIAIGDAMGVDHKLALRALERSEDDLIERLFEIISVHERAHLADAAQFLPLSDNPLSVIAFLISEGFSSAAVEARLEQRAELVALAASREADLVLAHVVEYGGGTRSGSHARGFRRILERFVGYLDDHLETFPTLAPDRNLLQQLHRLSNEEIRRVAGVLAEEEGVSVPAIGG